MTGITQNAPIPPESFFRVAIKGLHIKEGKVLLGLEGGLGYGAPVWDLPGGGLNFGETFAEGLRREVREETNMEITHIADTPSYIWTHHGNNFYGFDSFSVLLMAYQFEIPAFDTFTPTDECLGLQFFSKEEMLALPNVKKQTKAFMELFNPLSHAL